MTARVDEANPADVRDILGLRTPAFSAMISVVVLAMAFGASQSLDGLSARWPVLIVVAITGATTIGLIIVPHDPLPLGPGIVMALGPPVAAAILLMVAPVPLAIANQIWVSGYASLIYTFMCMRGRFMLAWVSVAISIAVHAVWSATTDQGIWEGAQIPVYNAGGLLAATLLAYAIRSTTNSILQLRAADAAQAAEAAAITARQQERTTRLGALDVLARPLLTRIAAGTPLSDAERQSCELLEAHLRDQLRAPALATPDIAEAARAARSRGVEVMMIDDGGLDGVSDQIVSSVRREVTATLQSAMNGDLRVRVMPPGRTNLVTIYRHSERETSRIEITVEGHILKNAPAPRIPAAATDI